MQQLSSTTRRGVAGGLGVALAALPALAFAQSGDDGSGAILGGLFIFYCLCFVISIAIDLALVYWVYTDAKKRGNPNAVLWAVLTFFFHLLGILLYMLIGRSQGTTLGGPPSGPAGTARY